MSQIDNLPPLREIVAQFEISARKSLGQNFLFDLNLTAKIARAAGDITQHVILEIGPGPGGLTRALLAAGAKKVVAIERDAHCLPALAMIAEAYPDRLEVIEADALTYDVMPHLQGEKVKIMANLPYNIGTALLLKWLRQDPLQGKSPPFYDAMYLMFQREVAERIVARPDYFGDAYGRLAIISGWLAECSILFDISPQAFHPPPKITSSVVEIIPRAQPESCDLETLEQITALAFGQRRKMLRQSLKALVTQADILKRAGIEETRRPETLAVSEFIAMARVLKTPVL